MKFVNYKKTFDKKIANAVVRTIKNGDFILRKDVEIFEKNLAKYVGKKYAIGVNSGTDALILSLEAYGIGKGDEVITSGYTYWATVEAIIRVGAKPILVDVGDDLLIDVDKIKITKKTKAIIPVHIGGNVCDMKRIMKLGVQVIEDSAQSLGHKPVSTSCYSFYPAKILGCYGDGGAVATDNKEIADKIRLLRNHGGKPYPQFVGYNSRLDNIQAVVLNMKLKGLNKVIKRRREIAKIYDRYLNGVKSQNYQEYNYITPYRDQLYEYLKKNNIETIKGDYTFPLPLPPKVKEMNKKVLRLPIFPTLKDKEIIYICKKIREYDQKNQR